MNKRVVYALLLVAVSVLVLIWNTRGTGSRISIDLIFTTVSALKSVVFFAFMCVGLVIGVLLK